MKYRARSICCLLLLAASHCFAQDDLGPLRETLQRTLNRTVATDKLPGATLAVVLPDRTLISLAAGFGDVDAQQPMPVGGAMLGGSTGKTLVSAVVLQLVSEGTIGLDDRVATHFSTEADRWMWGLPNFADLTVRSLMNHTSGMPDYISDAFLTAMKVDPDRSWTPQERLSFVLDAPPTHPVGVGWGYTDAEYILLGMIIERVTDDSLYNQLRGRLLEPLQMRRTTPSTQRLLPGLVQGYIGDVNPFGLPRTTVLNGSYAMNPQFEWGGGGFVTNVDDLASWMKELHAGGTVSPAMHAELVAPVDTKTGQPAATGYGLGTVVWDTGIGRFFGHGGVMAGYMSQAEFSERHGFAIAFQTNTDQGMFSDFGKRQHERAQELAGLGVQFVIDGQRRAESSAD